MTYSLLVSSGLSHGTNSNKRSSTVLRYSVLVLSSLQEFFEKLLDYMCSGPVVAMVWEGTNVIAGGRKVRGSFGGVFRDT